MIKSYSSSEFETSHCGLQFKYSSEISNGPESPLILLVHGRAGNDSLMWFFSEPARPLRPYYLAPQAPFSDPYDGEFSWWIHSKTHLNSPKDIITDEKDIDLACQKLFKFITAFQDLHEIKPREIIGIGFSQGAALLSSLSLMHPGYFSSICMLSGFLPQSALNLLKTPNTNSTPTKYFIAHGTKDTIIPLKTAENTVQTLQNHGLDVTFTTDPTTHKIGRNGMKGLKEWFKLE